MAKLQVFPFGRGLHQEDDNRIAPPGTPRAVENLIRVKNGRLRPRRDYETLAMTVDTGQTDLQLHDLHAFEDGRVLGIGSSLGAGLEVVPQRGATVVYELVEQGGYAWKRTLQSSLSPATQVRSVGALGKQQGSVTFQDAAAGEGLVVEVFDTALTAGGNRILVHAFDPATDSTVFLVESTSGRSKPRVVFCGTAFFITQVITSTGEIELFRFTPSTGVFSQLTSPVAAVAAINDYDFATSHEGTTMWIAVAYAASISTLRGLDSSGTVTYSAAGPAVQYNSLTILVHSTVSATQRLHILGVRTTGATMDLVTYLPPTTTPATTTNDIFNPDTSSRQVGLAVRELSSGTTEIFAIYQSIQGAAPTAYQHVMEFVPIDATTHALGTTETRYGRLISKLANIDSVLAFGMAIEEGAGIFTTCMGHIFRDQRPLIRPVTVIDRLLSADPAPFHLPRISKDASTGLSYWPHLAKTTDDFGQPRVTELKLNATDRRQSAELGSALYIAGGVMHVFDQRCIGEAGGFLTRPIIYDVQGANTASGALTLDGIYQVSTKFDLIDSLDRRMQSAPSDVFEFTLSGGQDTLIVRTTGVFSYWDRSEMESALATTLGRATPFLQTYRTQDTNAGQITLHQDISAPLNAPWTGIGDAAVNLIQSDVDISDNEVLYTQGARGALSGPLEFITPDPCTSLAASADRVLSGGLPRDSAMQESRPLLIGEQVQWSDSIGFYRDLRGRLLAVARLDERRILFTASEIFEADGPGVDDNGLGEIGAPRRLPSDVGLYGGVFGWRSIVEVSAGVIFQGLRTQIYLLPRGGVVPMPIGFSVEDQLAAYPNISAAVYLNEDQTIRFTCNNDAGDESIVLLLSIRFMEWFVEGPYAFTIRAATRAAGRFYLLTSANTVLRQRAEDTPLVFVAYAWRATPVHPWGAGMFGRSDAVWFYGTVRGDCRMRCIVTYDEDPDTTVTHEWIDVVGFDVGAQFRFRFQFDQQKCESMTVDFEFDHFQNKANSGLDLTYWGIEGEKSDAVNQVEPSAMT